MSKIIEITKEQKAMILLRHFAKLSNNKVRELLKLNSAYEIIKNPKLYEKTFADSKINQEKYDNLLDILQKKDYLNTFTYMQNKGIGVLIRKDEDYPKFLNELTDPPEILYYRGNLQLLKTRTLAVVGSRNPSQSAVIVAKRFVNTLALSGLTIVSGMAIGIDGISHKETLAAGGKTIAVLGSGINFVYPASNAGLYDEILEEDNLILSEYGPDSPPERHTFPERNRIISGISEGVLVIEAKEKSGSLITARCANEQNKSLYVVPCDVSTSKGLGSNRLILNQLNSFVIDAYDILDSMNIAHSEKVVSVMKLDYIESIIEEALKVTSLAFDDLLELTKLDVSKLTAILLQMELNNIITRLDNNHYSL